MTQSPGSNYWSLDIESFLVRNSVLSYDTIYGIILNEQITYIMMFDFIVTSRQKHKSKKNITPKQLVEVSKCLTYNIDMSCCYHQIVQKCLDIKQLTAQCHQRKKGFKIGRLQCGPFTSYKKNQDRGGSRPIGKISKIEDSGRGGGFIRAVEQGSSQVLFSLPVLFYYILEHRSKD